MRFFTLSLIINLALLFVPTFKLSAKNEEVTKKIEINLTPKSIEALKSNEKIEILKTLEAKNQEEVVEIIKETIKPKTKPKKAKDIKKIIKKPQMSNKSVDENLTQTYTNENLQTQNVSKISKNELKEKDFCKENVGFKLLDAKMSYDFPKKAKKLRLKGKFQAEVTFKIINGKIEIIEAKGSNDIFKDEAKKLTQNLNIEVLDEKVSKCLIIKPFLFISN